MKVFGYLRVSGSSQVDGDGPERQRVAIKAFCDKHNLTIVSWYEDMGVSGTVDALYRPGFMRMLECASEAQGVVAENSTRLARDNMVAEMLLCQCRKVNLKVFAADFGGLSDLTSNGDPTATAMRQFMQVFSQLEKSITVARLRAARERTGHLGGKPRWGSTEREKIIEDTMIQLAKKWESQGLSPCGRIAEALNEAELFGRKGEPWRFDSVKKHIYRLRKQGKLPQRHLTIPA